MKKLLIISAFVLVAFSSCNSDSFDISSEIRSEERAAKDGRNPQTGASITRPGSSTCNHGPGDTCTEACQPKN